LLHTFSTTFRDRSMVLATADVSLNFNGRVRAL